MNKRRFLGILRGEKINSSLIDAANKKVLLNKEIVLKNPKNNPDDLVSWILAFDDDEYNREHNLYTLNIDFLNEIYNAISDYSERDYHVSYDLDDVEVDWVDVQQKIDLAIEEGKKKEIALEVYKLINEVSLEKKVESLKIKDDVSENSFFVKWSEIISIFRKSEFDVDYYTLYSKKPLRRLYVDFLNREVDNNWKNWVFYGILNEKILGDYLSYDLGKFKDDVFSDDYWNSFVTSLKFEEYNVVDIWSNFYSLSIINERLSKIINQHNSTTNNSPKHSPPKNITLKSLFINDGEKYDETIDLLIKNNIIKKTDNGLRVIVPEEFKKDSKTFICSIGHTLYFNKYLKKECSGAKISEALNNTFGTDTSRQNYSQTINNEYLDRYTKYLNFL
ncbi:hypothetical protein ACPX19_01415 [Winogradskyella sp. HB-48]|uniref:hypothetical protein n=1 Tax=Winogradskyella sp. HB-48 TaxID=3416808 RepID=UPI003CED409A